jgi:hypothetical protein
MGPISTQSAAAPGKTENLVDGRYALEDLIDLNWLGKVLVASPN